MSDMSRTLKDDAARREAMSSHDRSILVEAGAGSGKTAVMAGRIALLLASGVSPRSIAAVTFTELAASELLERVRDYVHQLANGRIARQLQIALPAGLSDTQRKNLVGALERFDEMTCTTIHGFCQRLIKPYPAEANIDPGAALVDQNQADLTFFEIVDAWLRERLAGDQGGLLAEMVLREPERTVVLVRQIAESLRHRRNLVAPPVGSTEGHLIEFRGAVKRFAAFVLGARAHEPETLACSGHFDSLVTALKDADPTTALGLVQLLTTSRHEDLCTHRGEFLAYKKKVKWGQAAKQAGLSAAEGTQLFLAADGHYRASCDAWTRMVKAAASQVLVALIQDSYEILQRYRESKRARAQLDFDDLIFAARDLLRDHENVRQALGKRFTHVLVDEFQDTDPLQSEIFWRLCGDPDPANDGWNSFRIRPGALFLVGDPKQAIYRFRGADVAAYLTARDTFRAANPQNLLSISTNFRSCASILAFVNDRFQPVLNAPGQPGFTALDPFHGDHDGPCVAALDVAVPGANGEARLEEQRQAEADAVGDLCARLIGSQQITDRHTGDRRVCQAGDIALLAPTGAELWRYEEALERRGIPVSTQAGKGAFRRQEVQDLIALTRVLADRRDTLALGALLRGPLVGLTEEALLDIVAALPRNPLEPGRIPILDLGVDPTFVDDSVARGVIEKLAHLRRRIHSTTPHELLSQAVDAMRVRPILRQRHYRQAERALANVDLFLSLSTSYAVRGIRAFAEAMTAAWTEETQAVEGRPDTHQEAVALYTMHAAKGLEWSIVIPINTMASVRPAENAVVDRQTNIFYCSILDTALEGCEAARDAENAELRRERIRLWYVAATRARELLVLPRLGVPSPKGAWVALMDLSLALLPTLDVSNLSTKAGPVGMQSGNAQTSEIFSAEGAAIANQQRHLTWMAPSRDERAEASVLKPEEVSAWVAQFDEEPEPAQAQGSIQGSRERGLILHKLMEEVLNAETEAASAQLAERARELIDAMGRFAVDDATVGLSPVELAGCVCRTLVLPQIMAIRQDLLSEFPVYASNLAGDAETVIAGVADAITLDLAGRPNVIVDWKSDVAPDSRRLEHYRAQVRIYLEITGAGRGLIVLMTSGQVIEV